MASSRIIKTDFPFHLFSREADNDYLLARMITLLGVFHARGGYFAQQACEKYLKALSVQHDRTYSETHKLLELAAICEPQSEFLASQQTKEDLAIFDMFDQVGRYGGAANFDPLSKGGKVGDLEIQFGPNFQIAGAWIWTGEHLNRLDRVVFNIRGQLNFVKSQDQ